VNTLKYKDFFPAASTTHQERFKGLNVSLADALPIGILITDAEARLKRADGKDVWTRRHIAVMDEGMPGHVYVHTIEDIDVQKVREASRLRAEKNLDDKTREQVMLDFIGDGFIFTDTVCRYGGDEFLVLLNEIAEADHAVAVADKVREGHRSG
jgi:hypothetical protein